MSKPVPLPGGDLEARVLETLWELDKATAREVHGRIGLPANLAYTTIATVLDRLHAKGLVRREREGKAFVYFPKVKKDVLDRARARDVINRLLGQDQKPAIAALVDAVESIDPELLDELARQVAARRRTRRGP
jgi:BlaI family transcriptional regulator, penicillinase repressor